MFYICSKVKSFCTKNLIRNTCITKLVKEDKREVSDDLKKRNEKENLIL